MATSSERPERSFANERQLIELAKTLSLETIVKRTGRKRASHACAMALSTPITQPVART
jgi:hypothetical protein